MMRRPAVGPPARGFAIRPGLAGGSRLEVRSSDAGPEGRGVARKRLSDCVDGTRGGCLVGYAAPKRFPPAPAEPPARLPDSAATPAPPSLPLFYHCTARCNVSSMVVGGPPQYETAPHGVRRMPGDGSRVGTSYDLVIIGAGPAGYTAGIYGARAGHKTLLLSGTLPGGQLVNTTEVENYPGFEMGIMGPDLMMDMRKQAVRMGVTILDETATTVDFSRRPFRVGTGEATYTGRAVIAATGADPRKLGIESEQTLGGRGVSYCATCDGPFFRDQTIVVVGGGDTAMEEATFLTKFAASVLVVHRRDMLRASQAMQQRAFDNEKISFRWNSEVVEIRGEGRVGSVVLRDVASGQTSVQDAGAVFIAIGHIPNTSLFRGHLDLDEEGYIVVDGTKTSVPGVFAAGDVHDRKYRQAVTAAGFGCQAAIDADKYLSN